VPAVPTTPAEAWWWQTDDTTALVTIVKARRPDRLTALCLALGHRFWPELPMRMAEAVERDPQLAEFAAVLSGAVERGDTLTLRLTHELALDLMRNELRGKRGRQWAWADTVREAVGPLDWAGLWRPPPALRALARGLKGSVSPTAAAVLADACEEAGCLPGFLLWHLRGRKPCVCVWAAPRTRTGALARCRRRGCKDTLAVPRTEACGPGCWAVDYLCGEGEG
jgi:hypothetical protein